MSPTLRDGKEAFPHDWDRIHRLTGLRAVMVVLLTGLFSMYMIGLTATRSAQGRQTFHFEYVTVTLVQELSKLAIAFVCFQRAMWPKGCTWRNQPVPDGSGTELHNVFKFQTFLKYAVPGALYSFDNNFQYVVLGFLQPAELAVLWNFKIFATVVLMQVFLRRRYTRSQWAAVLVLVLGCALTQVPYPETVNKVVLTPTTGLRSPRALPHHIYVTIEEGPEATGLSSRKLIGAALAMVGSTIAASSNVYCEWLVKQHPHDSIHFQMMQLYSCGVILNALALAAKAALDPNSPLHHAGSFFAGYDSWVWTIIVLGTASGMAVSAALKYMDNIAVIFAHALAVLVVAAVSTEYFSFAPSVPFLIGGLLVLASLVVFNSDEEVRDSEHGSGGEAQETAPLCKRCNQAF
mmetsp:Transcript_42415/g.122702  ORF Transcript_42415/g.122702 Transcript_42415/m.122702 type:complete len:405 (-) Transcript_42415:64-1278(-)